MEAKEEDWIQQGYVMTTITRELDMTTPNSRNASHRTEYTGDDDGRCYQSDREREGNEACRNEGKCHEQFQLW